MALSTSTFTRRRLLRAAATAVPLLALAACGSAASTVTSTTATGAATTPGTAPTAARAAGSAAVPLSFVTWGSVDEIKVRQHYVDQFNSNHPAIKVTFSPAPQDYWNALQARMAGGEGPDVYYLEPAHTVQLQCRGALLDLSPYVQRDKFDLSDFYPAGPLEYTLDGKLWALNRDFANQDIFYNVDLFQKNGVPLPPKRFDATGWTFDDFLAACQKLSGGSGASATYGFAVPTGFRAYMAFVWSNGGDIVTDDAKKPALDQPNAVEGLQFLEDLVGKYHVAPTPAEQKAQGAKAMFFAGRLGMIVSIPANLAELRAGAKGFQWDVAPPPLGPHGTKRQVGGGGAGYGINGKTKYGDQSWELMQWVTSVDVQKQEVDAGTSMGSRLSVGAYFVQVNTGKAPANVQMFVDASKRGLHTDPHASGWLDIQDVLSKGMAPLWDASQPAKDVTTEVAREMTPLLLQPCGT